MSFFSLLNTIFKKVFSLPLFSFEDTKPALSLVSLQHMNITNRILGNIEKSSASYTDLHS